MARRTHLQAWDKRLLMRIRQGYWTADELQWVLDHLDEQTPTLQFISKPSVGWGGHKRDERGPRR